MEIPADIVHQAPVSHMRATGTAEDRLLNAAVTIFETHNVIELGGACLKDDRVL